MTLTPSIEAEGLALANQLSSYGDTGWKAAAFIRASLAREKAADEAHLAFRQTANLEREGRMAAIARRDTLLAESVSRIDQLKDDYSFRTEDTVALSNFRARIVAVTPPPPDPYEVKAMEIVDGAPTCISEYSKQHLIEAIAAALREVGEGK